ncbi:hypothetical protein EON82_09690 [bacterium]|nr:MAG: hypothetical protein EON82_09690 [bacterium]
MDSEARSALIALLDAVSVDPSLKKEAAPRVKRLLRELWYLRALSLDRPLPLDDLRFIRDQAPEAYAELEARYCLSDV